MMLSLTLMPVRVSYQVSYPLYGHKPSAQSDVSLTSGTDGPIHTYTTDIRVQS